MADIGKKVTLCGWVQTKRNLGAIIFIDIRDRYGITQISSKLHVTELKDLTANLLAIQANEGKVEDIDKSKYPRHYKLAEITR